MHEFCEWLDIRVIFDYGIESPGEWRGEREIFVCPDRACVYTYLHEIGHVLNGFMCCREHCEYAAHGAAVGMAIVMGLRLEPEVATSIDSYAGFTANDQCTAIAALQDG